MFYVYLKMKTIILKQYVNICIVNAYYNIRVRNK
jgi:hypothetical protein